MGERQSSLQAPKKPKSKAQKKSAEPVEKSEPAPKKKPGRKGKAELEMEPEAEEPSKPSPSKRSAEQAEQEKGKKKSKTSAVDMHLEALRSLKTEAQREEYLGNITLTMRMKVAEAQSMSDALPAEEPAEEAGPSDSKAKPEKKRAAKAKSAPSAKDEEAEEPSEAPAPSGRPKRAAAQQAEPEEVKKPKKFTAAVEKHMDELAKLKTQKQKEKYIGKLTLTMQTKVAAALSETEAPAEAEEPPSKKRAGEAKDLKEKEPASKARMSPQVRTIGFYPNDNRESNGKEIGKLDGNWDYRVVYRAPLHLHLIIYKWGLPEV